jgi:hypothetical protein
MLGCSKRASVRASCRKFERPHSKVRLHRSDFVLHAHGGVAVAEVEGVIFLDGDHGAEVEILGLIGNAETAHTHHALDAVAAVENGILRQSQATVQDTPSTPLSSIAAQTFGYRNTCYPSCRG